MLKRTLCLLVSILLICGLLIGCSSSKNVAEEDSKTEQVSDKKEENVTKKNEPIVMKIEHVLPTDSVRHEMLLEFKDIIEEKTNNGIKVEIYPAAQLGMTR